MIEVENLCKSFGNVEVLKNISFKVNPGEVLGFLGPNGAGKTTTMRILTCYLPASSGRASVAGFDVFEDSLEVRKKIGYLPESAPLYHEMGVLEYLDYIAQIRGISKNKRPQKLQEMIEVCGLEEVTYKTNGQLSRGYRQRVGLAQTLIHDPEILILDEPTSGLDPNQIVEIRELIKKIGKEKTVILCTHILPEVSATCDRVLIINDGVIIADGAPDDLARQASGGTIYYLKIKTERADVEASLKSIKGVTDTKSNGADLYGFRSWQVNAEAGVDLGAEFFQLAVSRGWILSELRAHEASLEDVFKKLTTGEGMING